MLLHTRLIQTHAVVTMTASIRLVRTVTLATIPPVSRTLLEETSPSLVDPTKRSGFNLLTLYYHTLTYTSMLLHIYIQAILCLCVCVQVSLYSKKGVMLAQVGEMESWIWCCRARPGQDPYQVVSMLARFPHNMHTVVGISVCDCIPFLT